MGPARSSRQALRHRLQARSVDAGQGAHGPARRPHGDAAAGVPRTHPHVATADRGDRPLGHDDLLRGPLPDPGAGDLPALRPALRAAAHRPLLRLRVDHRALRDDGHRHDRHAHGHPAAEPPALGRRRRGPQVPLLRLDLLAGLLRRADHPRRRHLHRPAARSGAGAPAQHRRGRPRIAAALPADRLARLALLGHVRRGARGWHRRRRADQAAHLLRLDDHHLDQPDDGCRVAPLPRLLQHLLQASRRRPHLPG